MRGLLPGLATPHPLGASLPGIYREDDLTQRLTEAFDDVLAPVLCALDNLDSYLDPSLTPDDFLAWLAECVGLAIDPRWPLERRRALVRRAVELYRQRGTTAGLAALVVTFTGAQVEVTDTGGAAWSATPGANLPGTAAPAMHVRVLADEPAEVDLGRLGALIDSFKPAHVPHTVEVVGPKS